MLAPCTSLRYTHTPVSQAEAWLWRSLVSQKGSRVWSHGSGRGSELSGSGLFCVFLCLTLTGGGALPHPNVFFFSLSLLFCIAWLFKTLMLGFHYGKCCLCPGRLEKAAKVSLAAVLSTCCPGNRRQGKQDLSDGKCQLQADLESRKQEWGGERRES